MSDRKLGVAQAGMLQAMLIDPCKGVSKSDFLGRDWKVIDRLEAMGLCRHEFVSGEGIQYLVTDAGRAALRACASQGGRET